MPIIDIFSKRGKNRSNPEVFIYDSIPNRLRVQLVHIFRDTIGDYNPYDLSALSTLCWDRVAQILKKEYGVFSLYELIGLEKPPHDDPQKESLVFLLNVPEHEKALDVIELILNFIDAVYSSSERGRVGQVKRQNANDAIQEVNARFLEHGVGYEYSDGRIIRKDSQFIHNEVVKEALLLLNQTDFEGPQKEFLEAYRFYRQGEYTQAISEASKAFESIMKIVCKKKKWEVPQNATANKLIEIMIQKGLIPGLLSAQLTNLQTLMVSGLPAVANNLTRHGAGDEEKSVYSHTVAYALHLCATNIVFIVHSSYL